MSNSETGEKAESFFGDKLYQRRARAAFPLLVRQARAQRPIYYADLAAELEIPNPRNLNYPLGSVGRTLQELGQSQSTVIPPIQCLVVNQQNEIPGEGIAPFLKGSDFRVLSKRQQRAVINGVLQSIYAYPHWDKVILDLQLQPAPMEAADLARRAAEGDFGGGGESEEHKSLKAFVACHPEILGFGKTLSKGEEEYPLPSGDTVDVLFRKKDEWIAVEVKSHISSDEDLARGIFQCVKYQAVLEAYLISIGREAAVHAALVASRPLAAKLVGLKNQLGVEVICIPKLEP